MPFEGIVDSLGWFAQLKIGAFIAYFFGALLFLMVIYSVLQTMY